ncbi:MAG: hypothetical protein AMXMBFR47_43100 [Planctomycetota bacterium]
MTISPILNGPETPEALTTGGDLGAYVLWTEPGHWGQAFYFEAPERFLGDQEAMYGGSVHWSIKNIPSGSFELADLVLIGGSTVLANSLPPQATADWTRISVRLIEAAGWENSEAHRPANCGELREVLRNLSAVRIRGEFVSGLETAGLDSVWMMPPSPDICSTDLDVDGSLGLGDLAILLSNFGASSGVSRCDGDITEDGQVSIADLALLLSVFGFPCQ